jgi:16S rRNA (guanine1207-N2)-methyltransferase
MIKDEINGVSLIFETKHSMFSPLGIDKGTLAMLSTIEFLPADKVLDLGCGYGVVGIYAAKLIGEHNVIMSDTDVDCVDLASKNAIMNGVGGIKTIHSDGFDSIQDTDFSLILSNPPYHADFSVSKRFIEKGFNRLKIGGKLLMVTKRKDWYKNKLIAIFGGVSIKEIDRYFVFCSEKRCTQYASANHRN